MRVAGMIAATNTQALWYLTRGTGVVSLLLLTASVALGIAQVTRWSSARFPRFVTAALHKQISLLVVVFLGVHIVTAIADGFAPIHWIDVVVPFSSAYRPVWLGLGAVAFDLLVALIVTSLLRQRIGYRTWRVVHWAAYASFPIALVHGLGTGSDTHSRWMLGVSIGCLAVVAAAVWWRLAAIRDTSPTARLVAGAATLAVPAAVVLFTMLGPLAPGWSRRAGTPSSLLGAAPAATRAGTSSFVPFSGAVAGSITTHDNGDHRTVTLDMTVSQARDPIRVRIALSGRALDGGGVVMDQSRVTLAHGFAGSVVSLQGTDLRSHLSDGSGTQITLIVHLTIDPSSNAVHGTAAAQLGLS
jgi:hypothetical protein